DCTAIIASSWLNTTQTTTRWPPYKSNHKFELAVKLREKPGKNWETWPCQVIKSYDTYAIARTYGLPRSVLTSDLSEAEDIGTRQRTRKRYLESDSDEIENLTHPCCQQKKSLALKFSSGSTGSICHQS
ncbi:unnamed protein product, partial [Allacma fusca]